MCSLLLVDLLRQWHSISSNLNTNSFQLLRKFMIRFIKTDDGLKPNLSLKYFQFDLDRLYIELILSFCQYSGRKASRR